MKKNMSATDAIIRIIIAIVIALLWFEGIIPGKVGVILLILGGILVLTGIFRICPLYYPFGISTVRKKGK